MVFINQEVVDTIQKECTPIPKWSVYFMLVMGMGSIVVSSGIVLQAIQVMRTDETEGLNVFTFTALAISSFMWFVYTIWIMRPMNILLSVSAMISFLSYLVIIICILK